MSTTGAAPLTTPGASASDRASQDVADAGRAALVVGAGGARRHGAVAAVVDGTLVAFCEQERITRIRAQGLPASGLPAEALRTVLAMIGRHERDITTYVGAEPGLRIPDDLPHATLDHHHAHAATAAFTSAFDDAAVLVCDRHSDPPVTVWSFDHGRLTNCGWPWSGPGFAQLYAECAEVLGFGFRGEHRVEAVARLDPGAGYETLAHRLSYREGRLTDDSQWCQEIDRWSSSSPGAPIARAAVAASRFQRCLGDALVALVGAIRSSLPHTRLCVGGGLFFNTYLTTRVVTSRVFDEVFVPVNPGNAGTAAGAALAIGRAGDTRTAVSPGRFLGPEFSGDEIKATLDNCKLTYEYLSEGALVDATADALAKGRIVGWFQGRMEWGPRSLGNRSILANPFSPHVLDNLNLFLKQRESYRSYGVSVCADEASQHFDAPASSNHMELEYAPLDSARFRYVLPVGARMLRVQTIPDSRSLLAGVHRSFGARAGAGILVNTSFNGFLEPIVCSPRDAVRVFYGTALDMLVIGRFVIRK